jgi:hypothetical protein
VVAALNAFGLFARTRPIATALLISTHYRASGCNNDGAVIESRWLSTHKANQ